MTWGWQDLAALAVVASALAYLARKFVPGLSRKPAGGCAHCPVKKTSATGSCCEPPAVVTLGLTPTRGKTGQGIGP
jgi:hypothetical protein